jgi:hypothetical protein
MSTFHGPARPDFSDIYFLPGIATLLAARWSPGSKAADGPDVHRRPLLKVTMGRVSLPVNDIY